MLLVLLFAAIRNEMNLSISLLGPASWANKTPLYRTWDPSPYSTAIAQNRPSTLKLHLEALFADVQGVGGQLRERPGRKAAQELLEPAGRDLVAGLPAGRQVPFPLQAASDAKVSLQVVDSMGKITTVLVRSAPYGWH